MECPNIGEIKFSQTSIDAIEEIKRKKELGNALIKVIGMGTVANIFVGNKMVEASYSLYSTDFEAMAKGMGAIPLITRKSIERVADMAWLNVSNHKEKQFWAAVSSGCKIY